jgi:hypothetical protein
MLTVHTWYIQKRGEEAMGRGIVRKQRADKLLGSNRQINCEEATGSEIARKQRAEK